MKLLSAFLVSAVNVVGFLSLTNLAYSKQPASVSLPRDSTISCEDSIAIVKSDLSRKGFFVPWKNLRSGAVGYPEVKFDNSMIREGYYGYPTNRTQSAVFVLGEVANLYSSPKFMAILASKIMAACNQVGLVEFAYWYEGSESVGYFPDNTARVFINLITESDEKVDSLTKTVKTLQGDSRIYQWGYTFSP